MTSGCFLVEAAFFFFSPPFPGKAFCFCSTLAVLAGSERLRAGPQQPVPPAPRQHRAAAPLVFPAGAPMSLQGRASPLAARSQLGHHLSSAARLVALPRGTQPCPVPGWAPGPAWLPGGGYTTPCPPLDERSSRSGASCCSAPSLTGCGVFPPMPTPQARTWPEPGAQSVVDVLDGGGRG